MRKEPNPPPNPPISPKCDDNSYVHLPNVEVDDLRAERDALKEALAALDLRFRAICKYTWLEIRNARVRDQEALAKERKVRGYLVEAGTDVLKWSAQPEPIRDRYDAMDRLSAAIVRAKELGENHDR